MDATDLKRFVANRHAVERRELDELRMRPLDPATSLRFALDLLAFDEALNGCPFRRIDPVEERDLEQVRENWKRLRTEWPRGR